jgi:hypothetical protein
MSSPVLAVWLEDALCFCANETTRKAKNLALNSHCVLTVGSDDAHLMVEGKAAKVRDPTRLQGVAEVYASKYAWPVTVRDGAFYTDGAPTASPPLYEVYEVRPTVVFGLGTDESFSPTH